MMLRRYKNHRIEIVYYMRKVGMWDASGHWRLNDFNRPLNLDS